MVNQVPRRLLQVAKSGLLGRAAGSTARFSSGARFTDPWFRKYDKITGGFVDAMGFMNRMPLRLESTEVMIYGTVDADKMWSRYADERFKPVLVGGKAVISIWFNNFKDTDCGGSYLESWYNTFVTAEEEVTDEGMILANLSSMSDPFAEEEEKGQLELPYESPMSLLISDPRSLIFLQSVVCGDAPGNPGAAMKAICGGRSVFGFPKHPVPADIGFKYTNNNTGVEFEAIHEGKHCVSLKVKLPEADEGAFTLPLEIETGPDAVIGAPFLGGTHKGMNGAHQTRFGQAFKCTQHIKPWDPAVDSLTLGDDAHYGQPLKSWGFEPLLKVHSPDFKIAAFQPSNWISGEEATAIFKTHEASLAAGKLAGSL